jgi:hypothetical protein
MDVVSVIEGRLQEIEAQLKTYDELARERDRLQRALDALRSDPGVGARGASSQRRATRRRSAGRRGARRAQRGSNVAAIIGHVTANPGSTAAEIAEATGIDRGVVYSATSRLATGGRLRRVPKGDRQVGYELAGGAATDAA